MKAAVIVVPTYNEKDNISELVAQIIDAIKDVSTYSVSVLFVDDSSPDGTGAAIEQLALHNNRIHLLSQEGKSGLGKAYIAGFKYAINKLGADVVFEMDADLSHDPQVIPQFLAKIDEGYDFVIGSRYVPGGTIPSDWTTFRKINSKMGNVFARYIAGLSDVQDCTSGYRAIRTSLLRQINLNKLGAQGYSFQMNLLHACIKQNARVGEIPINFIDRVKGKSKLSFADIREFVLNAVYLRMPSLKLFNRFAIMLMFFFV